MMLSGCASYRKGNSKKPNLLLIVADDVGYGDLGCYGDTNLVPTPNIDRLAKQGTRFTDAYVSAPVCGPTRFGLFTGAYQQRLGVQWNWDCWSRLPGGPVETVEENRIPPGQKVLPDPLEEAGYVTGIVGHWGLPAYPNTPFDETHSVIHYVADYWPDESGQYGGVDEPKAVSGFKDIKWGPEREGDEYLTDRLGRQSVDFIDRHQDRPFFLYLGFNAPHSPLQAKRSHRDAVAHLPNEALRFYGAMLLSMDENVGRVLDALEERGLAEDTLVAFISDNGPTYAYLVDWPEDWPRELLGSAGPLRGCKGHFLEGGIRVPFIMRWPSRLPAGEVYRQPVSALDIYPTFCAAAEAPVPDSTRLDGVNLTPFLAGSRKDPPHDRLYWYSGTRGAVRSGKWKLYVNRDLTRLYDLEADIGEQNDLSSEYPEKHDELLERFHTFRESMPPVLNPSLHEENTNAFLDEYRMVAAGENLPEK